MQLRQFVPSEYCGKCDVCCRFLDKETALAPTNRNLHPYKDRFVCVDFDPYTNKCKNYDNRPIDCRIYPFVVMYDEGYKNVVLGLDPKCPYITNHRLSVANYQSYLFPALKDIAPQYISRFQNDIFILKKLKTLTKNILKGKPVLRKLLIGDKTLFERYIANIDKPFSTYSFIANYIWTDLLDYYWTLIDDSLCLFCKTNGTIFMPLLPIPSHRKCLTKKVIRKCFELMAKFNKNKDCSRIEDISKKDLTFFEDLGYKTKKKGCEYICGQKELANLSGDKYKAKRALYNYFVKNYKFQYREFKNQDSQDCIRLFRHWAKGRSAVYKNNYYGALLEDSYLAHKKAMERYEELKLIGRVVVIDNKISAYTFGYELDKETFVILFEISDLNIKGLSQFIFREFCRELDKFKYINLMDDSGLENLRKTKLSYRPIRIEETFCAYG
ncbi:MAG: phosphatidylglycerol lysyltransferase domain-containing protein [Candidatus Omnitrophica bacterium]|nr:phosphatidylglycerol lysyltransferase domain-containing protein [Candidatus Omnitrophota bacterium]